MIENERQKASALRQIAQLKRDLSGPPSSWLGSEETRVRIMELRREIQAYDRSQAAQAQSTSGTPSEEAALDSQAMEGG